jgi:hypothetical protein
LLFPRMSISFCSQACKIQGPRPSERGTNAGAAQGFRRKAQGFHPVSSETKNLERRMNHNQTGKDAERGNEEKSVRPRETVSQYPVSSIQHREWLAGFSNHQSTIINHQSSIK